MKESYKEDLASNFGLELYADDGNGMGVATTGVYAGKLMSYDAVGNRRSLDAPDSGRFSYVYDATEQLSSVLNPFSELTTFSYDIAGRRTVQRYSNGTRASIIYDTANNVTQFHNRTSTGASIWGRSSLFWSNRRAAKKGF
jgi:YD repeat-containing protein